jgi:hypothetical protein
VSAADRVEHVKRRVVQLAEYAEEALYFASITDEPDHADELQMFAGIYATEARQMACSIYPEPKP